MLQLYLNIKVISLKSTQTSDDYSQLKSWIKMLIVLWKQCEHKFVARYYINELLGKHEYVEMYVPCLVNTAEAVYLFCSPILYFHHTKVKPLTSSYQYNRLNRVFSKDMKIRYSRKGSKVTEDRRQPQFLDIQWIIVKVNFSL